MSSDERDDEVTRNRGSGGKLGGILTLILLIVATLWVTIPSILIGYYLYFIKLFKNDKNRPSVIFTWGAISSAIAFLLIVLTQSHLTFLNSIKALPDQGASSLIGAIPFSLELSVILGTLIGFALVADAARQLSRQPYLTKIEDSWAYGFEYKPTQKERRERAKIITDLRNGDVKLKDSQTPLGISEDENKIISRYPAEARLHTLITGGTGAGKSISMRIMVLYDIILGRPLILNDYKGDPDFAAFVAAMCKRFGRPFYHFTEGSPDSYRIRQNPQGQAFYDVLKTGNATAKANLVLSMRAYDEAAALYKENMKDLLMGIFRALGEADRSKAPDIVWDKGEIAKLYSVLSITNFQQLLEATPENSQSRRAMMSLWENLQQGKKSSVAETMDKLLAQMRVLMTSDYGMWLVKQDSAPEIDLAKLTSDGKGSVIVFSINSETAKDFSRQMGRLIMGDITNLSVRRREKGIKKQVSVYLDEFQIVGPGAVADLLEKSRGSYLAVTLSMQSLSQITANSESKGDSDLDTILNTCSTFLIHAGSDKKQAERISALIGDHETTIYNSSMKETRGFFQWLNWLSPYLAERNMLISKNKVKEPILSASRLQQLTLPNDVNGYKSTAMYINKSGIAEKEYMKRKGGIYREVWVIPPSYLLEDYYKEENPEELAYQTGSAEKIIGEIREEETFTGSINLPEDTEESRITIPKANFKEQIAVYSEEEDSLDDEEPSEEDDGGFGFEDAIAESRKRVTGSAPKPRDSKLSPEALARREGRRAKLQADRRTRSREEKPVERPREEAPERTPARASLPRAKQGTHTPSPKPEDLLLSDTAKRFQKNAEIKVRSLK